LFYTLIFFTKQLNYQRYKYELILKHYEHLPTYQQMK